MMRSWQDNSQNFVLPREVNMFIKITKKEKSKLTFLIFVFFFLIRVIPSCV